MFKNIFLFFLLAVPVFFQGETESRSLAYMVPTELIARAPTYLDSN